MVAAVVRPPQPAGRHSHSLAAVRRSGDWRTRGRRRKRRLRIERRERFACERRGGPRCYSKL